MIILLVEMSCASVIMKLLCTHLKIVLQVYQWYHYEAQVNHLYIMF